MPKRSIRAKPRSSLVAPPSNRSRGDDGELDVIAQVECPHCGHDLQQLPPGFPIFDVQCTRCVFRAQVKTNATKPKGVIFGSGYQVLRHHLLTGQLMPPLIVNFRWTEARRRRQQIVLFPFLTKHNVRQRTRGSKGARPGYSEFNFVGLADEATPRVVLVER
jgi:hypothetical protein